MQSTASEPQGPPPAVRSLVGGILMGFANLVPGISGGTLILAVGLYDRFVGALADLSRMRPTRDGIVFLAWVGLGAVLAVVTLSSLLVNLVIDHRWAMYSLFVGMTLGGVPLVHQADDARFALLGGTLVGEGALLRFYVLHCVALPLVIGFLMAVHFWRVRKDGGISGPL